jgi:hypothetical protein
MLDTRIARQWDDDIVPQLIDYIRLPAKSPHFDHDWNRHGHIEGAIQQATSGPRTSRSRAWLEIIRLKGRTPVLFDVLATRPRKDRRSLRPPRQAARDDWLASHTDAGAENGRRLRRR